jgi:hypothetical protein
MVFVRVCVCGAQAMNKLNNSGGEKELGLENETSWNCLAN